MKLAFFGSDSFAVASLEALARAGHAVVLVVSNPDRPRGRSGRPEPTPVRAAADRLGLPVLLPGTGAPPGDDRAARPGAACADEVRARGAELGVVVAYGQYLTRSVRAAPALGYTINVHGSLLPRWRGASPIAAAILAGDETTGVTVQRVEAHMDTGPVLLRREVRIGETETQEALRERLAALGAAALLDAVAAIERGQASFEPQDDALATLAPLLTKEDGRLDLARPARELDRRVRACVPWPTAFVEVAGARLQVLEAVVARPGLEHVVAGAGAPGPGTTTAPPPGTILACDGDALVVATGDGALALKQVRPEGKKAMSGAAYARGRHLAAGARL